MRGDVLYGFFPPRVQATIDLVLYVVFFVPGIVAMVYAGWRYAGESWAIREQSTIMAGRAAHLHLQGLHPDRRRAHGAAGVRRDRPLRASACRTGEWPSRIEDVEEVDVDKLKEMVHVKDEDIATLDEIVVEQEQRARAEKGSGA